MMKKIIFVMSAALLAACASHYNEHGTDIAAGETGGMCGGIAGIQCPSEADFCKMEIGTCDIADNAGICTFRPEICTQDYTPVCGCDGVTYSNACTANAAGAAINHKGACK